MSSTARGGKRSPADFYRTPRPTTRALLRNVDLPDGLWCDPCCGDGAIVRAVEEARPLRHWWALADLTDVWGPVVVDTDEGPTAVRGPLSTGSANCVRVESERDFLNPSTLVDVRPDVWATNPPFRIAEDILVECLHRSGAATGIKVLRTKAGRLRHIDMSSATITRPADEVWPFRICLLMRSAWTESEARLDLWDALPPFKLDLATRPNFTGNGCDSAAISWFVWGNGLGGRWKSVRVEDT